MYIFIDDSGDPGIKFDQGSTRFFVIAAVIFSDSGSVSKAQQAISKSRVIGYKHNSGEAVRYLQEYKYSRLRSKRKRKDKFFESIKDLDFTVRAIVVDKQRLYRESLIKDSKLFQNEILTQLLSSMGEQISRADLILDGADALTFGIRSVQAFIDKINQITGRVTVDRIVCADSQKSDLIQLADMVAGTIRNYYENATPESAKDFSYFSSKCRSVWKLK